MSALICGSLAYDTIMVFPEPFRDHILPDKVHILNVSFLVPKMRREFGGCAGNIAYNLRLLGGTPYPMGTVGTDFGPYRAHFDALGISTRYILELPGEFSSQAFITTDIEDNQITAFHPGAMMHSHRTKVSETEGIKIGIVGPDGRQAMLQHSHDFHELGIPHIFDPGQGITQFNGEEFRNFIEEANWVVVNDYEFQILQERTGWDGAEIAKRVETLVVTRGGEGSEIITTDERIRVKAAKPDSIQDPTGCGDAYRAGLIHGILNDLDLVTSCRIGSVMGAIKIAYQGPQNHNPGMDEIQQRFIDAYGYRF